jgi:hypothetical protein
VTGAGGSADAGWGAELGASPLGGRWAAADGHHVYVWSGEALQRSIDLPGVLGGGLPRFVDGDLLVGRYAIDLDTGEATERIAIGSLAAAFDPQADEDRLSVEGVAWAGDGTSALVYCEYLPTRMLGERDDVQPGAMLALFSAGTQEVRVLDSGPFLGAGPVAGDRWLCVGGFTLRAFDADTGNESYTADLGTGVTALATLGAIAVGGLATGAIIRAGLADPEAPIQWARHGAVVDAVAISPDGALIASGDREGRLAVWSMDGAEQVLDLQLGDSIDGVCFLSAANLVVAVSGANGGLRHIPLAGRL